MLEVKFDDTVYTRNKEYSLKAAVTTAHSGKT